MVKKTTKLIYILFAVCAVLIILSVVLIFSSRKPFEIKELNVFFSVSSKAAVGVDLNNSALFFGRTSPGGSGITRFAVVDNQHPFPIEVKVSMSKNLIPVLYVNSSFFVEPKTNISIPIRLAVPDDFSFGNYTGKIRIETYKAEE